MTRIPKRTREVSSAHPRDAHLHPADTTNGGGLRSEWYLLLIRRYGTPRTASILSPLVPPRSVNYVIGQIMSATIVGDDFEAGDLGELRS